MTSQYSRVVLIWPVTLPGTGELRAEIDAAADGVELIREDGGALVISRGDEVRRIERPDIESATLVDGSHFARSHVNLDGVPLEREPSVVVLYRPVGNAERDLIAASGWKRFPPRSPDQPIFFPVTNLEYAREIATRWNAVIGSGTNVVRFRLQDSVLLRWLPVRCVGARHHTELWIPAEDLDDLNDAIVGVIQPVA